MYVCATAHAGHAAPRMPKAPRAHTEALQEAHQQQNERVSRVRVSTASFCAAAALLCLRHAHKRLHAASARMQLLRANLAAACMCAARVTAKHQMRCVDSILACRQSRAQPTCSERLCFRARCAACAAHACSAFTSRHFRARMAATESACCRSVITAVRSRQWPKYFTRTLRPRAAYNACAHPTTCSSTVMRRRSLLVRTRAVGDAVTQPVRACS
jgi:hypothetical protein